MTNTLTMRRSNLVLPTSGYELDRDEMCYVEGGGKIGTYAWNNDTGVNWLRSQANMWLANFSGSLAAGVLSAVAAAISSPTVVGAAIFGILSGLMFVIAGISFAYLQSAVNAMEDAQNLQRQKKSYTVSETFFLFVFIGYKVT